MTISTVQFRTGASNQDKILTLINIKYSLFTQNTKCKRVCTAFCLKLLRFRLHHDISKFVSLNHWKMFSVHQTKMGTEERTRIQAEYTL